MSLGIILLYLSSAVAVYHGHGPTHYYSRSSGHSGYIKGLGLAGYPAIHQSHQQHRNKATWNYSPQQRIIYGSIYYPVYQGLPPVYVYQYRDSGSRFDNLLTGLALYNLGRNSHDHHYYDYKRGTPGEVCKMGIRKRTGEYEETRIDCNLMSSFIWEDTSRQEQQTTVKNTKEVTVTETSDGTNANTSVTVMTVKSETVVDALKAKGPSIAVTPGMTCYMIRLFRDTIAMRKPVDCGLLQEYARRLFYRNGSECLMPLLTILIMFKTICLITF